MLIRGSVNRMLAGEDFDYHCHSNLTRAIVPFGLAESDVHDVLNVFQVTGLNKDGQYYMYNSISLLSSRILICQRRTCPAKPGDYFEFFAEIDVLCALSTCPGGDLSKFGWGEGNGDVDMLDCCRPLGIEVYDIQAKAVLKDWQPPVSPNYKGIHGVKMPTFERAPNH